MDMTGVSGENSYRKEIIRTLGVDMEDREYGL
jgi:hypothetical protein